MAVRAGITGGQSHGIPTRAGFPAVAKTEAMRRRPVESRRDGCGREIEAAGPSCARMQARRKETGVIVRRRPARSRSSLPDQPTSVASSVILALSSLETGQPAFALAASSSNFA
jgi:hypothetical protein